MVPPCLLPLCAGGQPRCLPCDGPGAPLACGRLASTLSDVLAPPLSGRGRRPLAVACRGLRPTVPPAAGTRRSESSAGPTGCHPRGALTCGPPATPLRALCMCRARALIPTAPGSEVAAEHWLPPAQRPCGPGLPSPSSPGSLSSLSHLVSLGDGLGAPRRHPGEPALCCLAQGPSRMLPDSEAAPAWGAASPGALQPPSLTPAPEVKSPVQAARKEAKEPKKVPHGSPPARVGLSWGGWRGLGRGRG